MIWPFKKEPVQRTAEEETSDRIYYLWQELSASIAYRELNGKTGAHVNSCLGRPFLDHGVKYYPVYREEEPMVGDKPIEYFLSVEEFESFINAQKEQRKAFAEKRKSAFKQLCEDEGIDFEKAKNEVLFELQ